MLQVSGHVFVSPKERHISEKATFCMILSLYLCGKAKTENSKKISGCQGIGSDEKKNRQGIEDF